MYFDSDGRTFYIIRPLKSWKRYEAHQEDIIHQTNYVAHPLSRTNISYFLKNNSYFQLPFSSRTPLSFTQNDQVYMLGKRYLEHEK